MLGSYYHSYRKMAGLIRTPSITEQGNPANVLQPSLILVLGGSRSQLWRLMRLS
jgi:hypothetical protein